MPSRWSARTHADLGSARGGARGDKGGLRRHHLETVTGASGPGRQSATAERVAYVEKVAYRLAIGAWPELVLSADAGAEVISVNASPGGWQCTRSRTQRTSSVPALVPLISLGA